MTQVFYVIYICHKFIPLCMWTAHFKSSWPKSTFGIFLSFILFLYINTQDMPISAYWKCCYLYLYTTSYDHICIQILIVGLNCSMDSMSTKNNLKVEMPKLWAWGILALTSSFSDTWLEFTIRVQLTLLKHYCYIYRLHSSATNLFVSTSQNINELLASM